MLLTGQVPQLKFTEAILSWRHRDKVRDPVELPSRHSAALAVLTWARVTRFPDNSTTWSKPSDRSAAA